MTCFSGSFAWIELANLGYVLGFNIRNYLLDAMNMIRFFAVLLCSVIFTSMVYADPSLADKQFNVTADGNDQNTAIETTVDHSESSPGDTGETGKIDKPNSEGVKQVDKATEASATEQSGRQASADESKTQPRKTEKQKNDSDQQKILTFITQLKEINVQLLNSEGEETVNQLLTQKNSLLGQLMTLLRSTNVTTLPPEAGKEKLSFLSSRIAINQERGYRAAVLRDQVQHDYYTTSEAIRTFVLNLIIAADNYKSVGEVEEIARQALNEKKQTQQSFKLPEVAESSKIYQDLQQNYNDWVAANNTYQDLIDYTLDHPGMIVSTHFFQFMTIEASINTINSIELFKPINRKLSPLQVDMGGILTSLLIFFMVVFTYPVFFRFSDWFITQYIFDEEYGNEELVYEEMRKPIKFLLIFMGIDLATYALFYKTDFRSSLDSLSFVIYVMITIWLIFKVLDCLALIQIQKISRSNLELRKELFNLGVQAAKWVIVILLSALVLNHFGISITAIMSTLGIGGLAFALAAKDTLSNLFGGATILFDNVFKMGDWVQIGDLDGTVAEIGMRSTTIRTFDNALVTIPNSAISVSNVKNWNRRAVGRRIKMHVGVTYESDMNDIRNALNDLRNMLLKHPGIANPKQKLGNKKRQFRFSSHEDTQGIKSTQLVYLDRFSDFSIDILIYCFSKSVVWSEWLEVKEDVLFKIAEILKKNHLEFAYPTQVMIMKGGEPTDPQNDISAPVSSNE